MAIPSLSTRTHAAEDAPPKPPPETAKPPSGESAAIEQEADIDTAEAEAKAAEDDAKTGEAKAKAAEAEAEAEAKAAEAEALAEEAEAEAKAAEAEALAEEAALLAEDRPDRAAPPNKGAIWGTIKGAVDQEPLPEASVTVLGTKWKTVADYDGRYRLELPPGTYTLRFFYELHRPALVKDITVKLKQVERIDASVVPDEASVETFVVETQADKSSIEGQVLARQRSTAVGDGVGRAEIARTPATNAAQAAERVVGATIVGSRFVFVRGLGERYTNSLLNGVPLPSPEPDRAAIPLDLFPALILDNITIVKSFTPDIPGDFAGGSVNIQTRELPSKPLYQLSLKVGYNDQATFRDRAAQRGSSTDFLGFDSGLRALPDTLRNTPYRDLDADRQLQARRDVNSYMSPKTSFTPPEFSLGGVIGNGWDLGKDRRLGAMITLNYGRSFTVRDDMILRRVERDDNETGLRNATNYVGSKYGNDRVNWGTLASVSFWPNRNHRLTLVGLRTQIADSSVQVINGLNTNLDGMVGSTRLTYVSRALTMGQLRGEHDFPTLANAKVDWNGTIARAARSEPNTRDTVFNAPDGRPYSSTSTPENGSHLYSAQGETTKGAGFNWSQPLAKAVEASRIKVGGLVTAKSRDFWARRYTLSSPSTLFSCGESYTPSCADSIYTSENLENGTLIMTEETRREDAYKAGLNVYSTYAMADVGIGPSIRVVGGARVEVTRQYINPVSPFPEMPPLESGRLNSTDVLPSLGIIFSATSRFKTRLTASRTLARPQIRELSQFTFTDYFGGRAYSGNPDLKLTHINNLDMRFEYFPTQAEVAAVSFFFKDFEKPIENVIIDSGADGTIMPRNTPGAKLLGVEFEGRKGLGFLTQALDEFTFIGNLTLSKSVIDLQLGEQVVQLTSRSRPMVNQSPFVVNLSLDYASKAHGFGARLLYNVFGKRIVEVGSREIADSYEHPRHVMDLTLSQKVAKQFDFKIIATNLLGSSHVVTAGSSYDEQLILRSYREPRIFSLVGTYTH